MRKTVFLLVLIIFAKFSVAQWRQIDPGTKYRINKIVSINSNIMLLVGDSDVIMRSDDKGESWNSIFYTLGQDIYDIAYHTPDRIYIPSYCKLHISTDTGMTWQEYRYRPSLDTIVKIFIPSDVRFYAINSKYDTYYKYQKKYLYYTEDSGKYWSIHTNFAQIDSGDVFFFDSDTACYVFKKILGKTFTGFLVTNDHLFPMYNTFIPFTLSSIYLPDKSICYAINKYGIIAKFHNPFKDRYSKVEWDSLLYNKSLRMNEHMFLNKDTGFIVGDSGLIIRTLDGGKTWLKLNSGVTENLINLAKLPSGEVFVYGDKGILLKTDNLGGSGDTILSVKTINSKDNMYIYPNPTTDYINIRLNNENNNEFIISLLDDQGKILKEFTTNSSYIQLPVSEMPRGLFYLRICSDHLIHIKKLIIL